MSPKAHLRSLAQTRQSSLFSSCPKTVKALCSFEADDIVASVLFIITFFFFIRRAEQVSVKTLDGAREIRLQRILKFYRKLLSTKNI